MLVKGPDGAFCVYLLYLFIHLRGNVVEAVGTRQAAAARRAPNRKRPSCNISGLRAACAACMHVLTLLHTNTARLAALLTALDPAALVLGTLLLVQDRCLLSNWHESCPACVCPCANDALAKGLWLRDGRTCHTQAVLKYGIDQRRQSVQLEGQPLRPALLGAAVLGHSAADDATCTPKCDMQAGVGSIRVVVIVQVLSGDWQLWCSC